MISCLEIEQLPTERTLVLVLIEPDGSCCNVPVNPEALSRDLTHEREQVWTRSIWPALRTMQQFIAARATKIVTPPDPTSLLP